MKVLELQVNGQKRRTNDNITESLMHILSVDEYAHFDNLMARRYGNDWESARNLPIYEYAVFFAAGAAAGATLK